jgi:hypothetical protein
MADASRCPGEVFARAAHEDANPTRGLKGLENLGSCRPEQTASCILHLARSSTGLLGAGLLPKTALDSCSSPEP